MGKRESSLWRKKVEWADRGRIRPYRVDEVAVSRVVAVLATLNTALGGIPNPFLPRFEPGVGDPVASVGIEVLIDPRESSAILTFPAM